MKKFVVIILMVVMMMGVANAERKYYDSKNHEIPIEYIVGIDNIQTINEQEYWYYLDDGEEVKYGCISGSFCANDDDISFDFYWFIEVFRNSGNIEEIVEIGQYSTIEEIKFYGIDNKELYKETIIFTNNKEGLEEEEPQKNIADIKIIPITEDYHYKYSIPFETINTFIKKEISRIEISVGRVWKNTSIDEDVEKMFNCITIPLDTKWKLQEYIDDFGDSTGEQYYITNDYTNGYYSIAFAMDKANVIQIVPSWKIYGTGMTLKTIPIKIKVNGSTSEFSGMVDDATGRIICYEKIMPLFAYGGKILIDGKVFEIEPLILPY